MDYIGIWGKQKYPEHFQNMQIIKLENPKDFSFFYLFSLERLACNNREKVLNKNITFKLTFLLKQCLHVKNDIQLYERDSYRPLHRLVFWSKDKRIQSLKLR